MMDRKYIILITAYVIILMICILGVVIYEKRQEKKVIEYNYVNILELEEKIQLEYFTKITGKKDIAKLSIKYTKIYNVDLNLFVALMKAESRFYSYAINFNIYPNSEKIWSVDRGLCQLNSATFPYLTDDEFFNPEINIANAVSYLKECMVIAGNNQIKALAYYNAGEKNVKSGRMGERTLNYICYILREKERFDNDLKVLLSEVCNGNIER